MNEEIARFFYYQRKLNANNYYKRWMNIYSMNLKTSIEYLSKGGFGEIYKTTWIYGGYNYYRKRYDENITTIQSDDKIAKEYLLI